MRALSRVCGRARLLVAVVAAAGCSAGESQGEQAVPPGRAGCAISLPDELASVRAGAVSFDKGLIAPPSSVACAPPDTGTPQLACSHDGSSLAVLPDGTLAAAWYHGVADKSTDAHLLWSRLIPGAAAWTVPEVLYDDPRRADTNPALWVAGDGTLAVFYATLYGSDWTDARPFLIRSSDAGTSWSPPLQLNDRCWMVRQRPLRLHSGELLLPLYDDCLYVPVFLRSRDAGVTWQPGKEVSLLEHSQQIQPALVQRGDGTVVALTRDATTPGRIAQMTSTDDGTSWSPSVATALPSPATALDQLRLPSGHVVVVFNSSPDAPFPLTAALSLDEGRTFSALRELVADCPEGPGKCAYTAPSIAYDPADSTLWVTYTHNQQTIGWVHFSEAWLAAGQSTALVRCTAQESCTTTDHTCQRLCQNDLDCVNPSDQAVAMRCATSGVCQPVCPTGLPSLFHCAP